MNNSSKSNSYWKWILYLCDLRVVLVLGLASHSKHGNHMVWMCLSTCALTILFLALSKLQKLHLNLPFSSMTMYSWRIFASNSSMLSNSEDSKTISLLGSCITNWLSCFASNSSILLNCDCGDFKTISLLGSCISDLFSCFECQQSICYAWSNSPSSFQNVSPHYIVLISKRLWVP